MFEIEYKGGNTVVITSKKISICADPRTSVVGVKDQKTAERVELGTETRFLINSPDARLVVDGPGDYEVGDFTIHGVAATRHIDTPDQEMLATLYRIECGDVRIALIGNADPHLSDEQLEQLGVIDMLILPVGGGGYTLDATNAMAIISQIEPKVIVPIHYDEPGLRYEVPQESLDLFTKQLGAPVEETPKYKVKSLASLPVVLTVVQVKRTA